MSTIFVNIASYADPELLPTVKDCLAQADHPENLRFGICWQREDNDNCLAEYLTHSQFRIDPVPASESKGCCWARARSQALYAGETYTLQLDGHHRFEPGWDTTLIEMLHQTGAKKPIITAYAGSYTAEEGKKIGYPPCKMKPKPFGKDGALVFVPVRIPDCETLTAPVPARFLSGHFYFTLGQHCREVPYDPNLYFHGEEPSMGVRSFTHGYDLFHPQKIVIWHQYHRNGRPKHWDQHSEWTATDRASKARVRQLFGMEPRIEDFTGFDFGTERSLDDFERFAGVDFKNRRLHHDCFIAMDPPTAQDDRWTVPRSVLIHWDANTVSMPEDTTKIAYFVDDAQGRQLWHVDGLKEDNFQCPPIAEFCSLEEPAFLVVWPHTAAGPIPKKYKIALSQKNLYITY